MGGKKWNNTYKHRKSIVSLRPLGVQKVENTTNNCLKRKKNKANFELQILWMQNSTQAQNSLFLFWAPLSFSIFSPSIRLILPVTFSWFFCLFLIWPLSPFFFFLLKNLFLLFGHLMIRNGQELPHVAVLSAFLCKHP